MRMRPDLRVAMRLNRKWLVRCATLKTMTPLQKSLFIALLVVSAINSIGILFLYFYTP